MATLKKYDLAGNNVGTIDVDGEFADFEAHGQMIKDYIVALRRNARQWCANTKTRAEVKHTTKKVYKQKGTGRARHGMTCVAQFRGGGIVFGPRAKYDQHVRINKKERRAAIHHLIAEKIRDGKMIVLSELSMDYPKTKTVSDFLKSVGHEKKVLFLSESAYAEFACGDETVKTCVQSHSFENLIKSLRNIPQASYSTAMTLSGFDVVKANTLVITEQGLRELVEWLHVEKRSA